MMRHVARVVLCGAMMLGAGINLAAQTPPPDTQPPPAPRAIMGLQPWEGFVYVSVNWAQQHKTQDFRDFGSFIAYQEDGAFDLPFDIGGGSTIDGGGGVRVWQNLAIGFGYSAFNDTVDSQITARVPHPIFFKEPRTTTLDVKGLKHKQRAVHLLASWVQPVGDHLQVQVFLGPAFYNVKQDFVSSIAIAETGPPFTTVQVTASTPFQVEDTGTGVTVGADLAFFVTKQIGGGLFIRYSAATVEMEKPASRERQKIDAGGFQIGVGARARF